MNIDEIKNTSREFQAQNGQKFKNTQAEFKKVVSYKKKSVYPKIAFFHHFSAAVCSCNCDYVPQLDLESLRRLK